MDLTSINHRRELRHPYYKLMKLETEALKKELSIWSRSEVIEWLCWNDRNGIYSDEDSMGEFGTVICREEAMEILIRQVIETQIGPC